MAHDDINKAMRKSRAVMDRLQEGDTYQQAMDNSDKSLEYHAQKANEEFPEFNKEFMAEQKAKAKQLRESVLEQLVGQGLDELESGALVEDIMERYPAQANRIMEGVVGGDLRYVSKDEYEAIKDRFPLMETK
tara:strand:- start:24439 stop:24837 length:399 start_codon:yes stop_codon:yes gene_type:complete